MKNLVLLMVAFFALGFSACSDDDDDSIAQSIAAKYTGSLEVVFGTPTNYKDQIVNVTATSDDRITFELKNFKFGEISVGDVVIKDILVKEVKETDDDGKEHTYKELSGSGKIKVTIVEGENPVELEVDVEGDEYDGELYVELVVKLGITPIHVTFEGKR